MNPLRHMAVDAKMAKIYSLEPPEDKEKIPIIGLNPVQELLNVLRVCVYYYYKIISMFLLNNKYQKYG